MTTHWKCLEGLGKPIKKQKQKQKKKQRNQKAKRLYAKDYSKYIKSKKWYKKRAKYIGKFGFGCYCCKEKAKHLHHISYDRLGYERMEDLCPLCVECHETVHIMVMNNESKLKDAHEDLKQILCLEEELRVPIF